MSACIRRFGAFGSSSGRGKAAGAVIACAVMLLTACGGSVTGGGATDAPVVRGDTLGRDWESTYPLVDASAGQVVVTWDKQIEEDPTESVVGYEVQISSARTGPWTGAGTGCARSETKSSTRQKCIATGLADGTYFFNVAAVRQPVVNKDKTGNFSRDTRTGNFSAGSPPAIVLSPPGIPATPTVVVGESSVTVTVAAGTTGGIPEHYTVTPSPATTPPMTCTVTGASGSCDVTGLKDSTAYTFTATATNTPASGTPLTSLPSAASSPAQFVTVSGTPTTAVFGTQTPISLTTTGGSSGAVTFTVTGPGCTVTGTSLTATRNSTCTVTATQGAHKSTAAFPFTPPVNHQVRFTGDGVDLEYGSDMPLQVAKGTTALNKSEFTSLTKIFTGWATYSGGPTAYADQALYPFTEDAALYATWRCKSLLGLFNFYVKERTSEGRAHFEFSASSEFGAWTSYTMYTINDQGQSGTVDTPGGSFAAKVNVDGLRRHKGYSFKLQATNGSGCTYGAGPFHLDKFD
jgi:hypothetical protein